MSNDVLTAPEEQTAARQQSRLDHTELLPIGAEGGVWESLVSNIRDVFRPAKLPPLELTSTAVPVNDPFAVKRSPLSSAIAILFYLLLALLILFFPKHPQTLVKKAQVTPLDIDAFVPKTPLAAPATGGGGGGAHENVPPTKGKLPDFAKTQITPPQVLLVDHPKLPVPATVVMPPMKMPDANLPNMGIPQASAVTLSAGNGGGSGIGSGNHGGIGSGGGPGIGPGTNGGTGGGAYTPGTGGVSSPKVLFAVDPEFSDEARRQKYQGVVVLSLIVDAQGLPQHIRVIRNLGMGLDEKAVEAVKQYKFKPAMKDGHPVPVEINIEVNFQLF
jgi:protein TonB